MATTEPTVTPIRAGELSPAPALPSQIGIAHHQLIARLMSLRVPRIAGTADGPDIRALSDYLVEVADASDALVAAVGRELKAHAPSPVETALFERPFFKSLEGEALHEIATVADELDGQEAVLSMWDAGEDDGEWMDAAE
jgi:hypothetical protein